MNTNSKKTVESEDKITDITFYIMFGALALGLIFTVGYLVASLF